MRPFRVIAAIFAAAATLAAAQGVQQTTTDSAKAPPARKAEPRKAEPKKTPTKKTQPKKTEPKKADAKKTSQPPKKETVAPGITRYSNQKDAPVMRDSQGNVIPTSPDAYDVSSATGGKKK
jgi:outer membrane biosynthesis protein TonB